MIEHCQTPIRLNDLVAVAGLSMRGYQKAFRKRIDHSPGEALRLLRIDRARRLLVQTDLSLADVAAQSGFRKVNSFWVAFRRVTGLAPTQYRLQARLEKSANRGKSERRR